MPQSAKEQVDITALIRGILNGYPGNSAIFREYLQNSDDAKATSQIFVLDERTYPSQTICDPTLRESQGSSLLAMNDGRLRDSDWDALKKIHSSSKKRDETQTGKNGLGFRASYHLTENPHVLSGENLMILDPHHRFSGDLAGGLTIDLTVEGVDFPDQLAPFKTVVDDPSQGFEGTAFRLPLRTLSQAKISKIKEEATSMSEICDLLHNFGNNELEDAILFLKHITTIEVRHVSADGTNHTIGKVTITKRPTSPTAGSFTRTTTLERNGDQSSRLWHFQTFATDKETASALVSERLGYDVRDTLTSDKLTPSVELATSFDGEPIRGSLYTLLPLPIRTDFPIHINAAFALTPDRQSLKNMDEVGTAESRERRLVEWNRVILNQWTPKTWSGLLKKVSASEPRFSWTIWPSAPQNPYWNGLLRSLIEELVQTKASVFPALGDASQRLHLDDPDVLLAPRSSPLDLEPLISLGMKIVQPPSHVFDILSANDLVRAPVLSPRTLHHVLKVGYRNSTWSFVELELLRPVIEYLVFSSSGSLQFIADLPWFSTANGSRATLQPTGSGKVFIVAASEGEATLFASYEGMLGWHCTDDRLRSSLLKSKGTILNSRGIQTSDLITILASRFAEERASALELASNEFEWVMDFWRWFELLTPKKRKKILVHERLKSLYLLPTSSKRLRVLSDKVAHFEDTADSATWRRLGVPTLSDDTSNILVSLFSSQGILETPQTMGFVPFLLNNIDARVQLLRDVDIKTIRQSLYASIAHRHPRISQEQRAVFEQLKIFATRPLIGGTSTWGSVVGSRVQVALDNDFPLPVQEPPVVYVDVRDRQTESFMDFLDGSEKKSDLDILRLAMNHWDRQPPNLLKLFVEHILHRSRSLSESDKLRLQDLRFVSVNGSKDLNRPRNLIHPASQLTPLYEGEVARIPTGLFTNKYLPDLQALGFLSSALNPDIIEERLAHMAQAQSDPKFFQKSILFIKLLDKSWDPEFAAPVSKYRQHAWLPLSASERLSPIKSRDHHQAEHASPYLYDLVLRMVDTIFISSPGFRSSLGWSDPVGVDILIQQLRAAVALPLTSSRYDRLKKLLDYLGERHKQDGLDPKHITELQEVVENRSWIPVLGSATETVASNYALIREVNLKAPFRQVHPEVPRSLLSVLGCPERPTLQALLCQLGQYDNLNTADVQIAVALLEEIAEYHNSVPPLSLSIPSQGFHCHPLDAVYYPDLGNYILPPELADRVAVHSNLSRSLCEKLQIPTLSALLLSLGDEAFDEDEQMSEDLVTRIHAFLLEYDITYAFNEFLANADDAHAGEFKVLLDSRRESISASDLISSTFMDVLSRPTLYFLNDATFTDHDFKGLRRIGKGGKEEQTGTHGRYGLGSLACYYFTDVVTIISGEYTMILDPASRYLPHDRGRKRTSLCRRTCDLARQFPGHLKRYLCDLNLGPSMRHNGTVFCLPLDSNLSGSPCDSHRVLTLLDRSYRELAQHAFFFTSLTRITAQVYRQSYAESNQDLWSFSAERDHQNANPDTTLRYHRIKLILNQMKPQEWLVLNSPDVDIPEQHRVTAKGLKLNFNGFRVQIAIQVSPMHLKPELGWLFSSLRLPRRSFLPFHLNARFAISSNRQSIVLDSPDSEQSRDAKSAFNSWILSDVVPPLYLATLEYLVQTLDMRSGRWWLLSPAADDGVSKIVSESFLLRMAESDVPLFRTVGGTLVNFKNAVFEPRKDPPSRVISLLTSLNAPRLALGYSALSRYEKATIVNPSFVKEVLEGITLGDISNLCEQNKFDADFLIDLVLFVGTDHITPGLPLLMLSSKSITRIPDVSQRPVYFSNNPAHANLFTSASFLHIRYSHRLVDTIWPTNGKVVKLVPESIPQLLQQELESASDNKQREAFLTRFWDHYDQLPGPPEVSSFKHPSIRLLLTTSGEYITLEDCLPESVIYLGSAKCARELGQALDILGMKVLQHKINPRLKHYLSDRFPPPEVNVLQCLAKKNVTTFTALGGKSMAVLVGWLKEYVQGKVFAWRYHGTPPEINKNHLRRLQIWKAQTRQGEVLRSLEQVKILPAMFKATSLSPFLRPNIAIAENASHLVSLSVICKFSQSDANVCMSITDVLQAIRFPTGAIGDTRIHQYRCLFSDILLSFRPSILQSVSNSLQLVNTDGEFRHLSDLYDHNVPLFSTCLAFSNRSKFIHPILRDLNLDQIRHLGLVHQISLPNFAACSRALEQAIEGFRTRDIHEDYQPDLVALRTMASEAFASFALSLPPILMRNQSSWDSLNAIQFVRVKDSRRQGASYPAEVFCERSITDFASPSQCILSKYEPIAWTQRALFFEEPTDDLTAVHQTLGVPQAEEVVNHLGVLTLKISKSHPGNSTLLSDIKATYKWLNDHADDAREYLLLFEGEALFLNVDDPAAESWVGRWTPAQKIVLNISYDWEDFKHVRGFLDDYPNLLRVAGCRGQVKTKAKAQSSSTADNHALMNVFNDMRQAGELTDIEFYPTCILKDQMYTDKDEKNPNLEMDVDSDIMTNDLLAHRAFLAATVPHLRDQAGFKQDQQFRFYDFIYTGDFSYKTPSFETIEPVEALLFELIELLSVADAWQYPGLTARIEHHILLKHDLVNVLFPHYKTMLERARRYNAKGLEEALLEWAAQNPELMREL